MKTLARERDKTELLERLRRLGPDCQRRWGRMTVRQMVCHASDCCRLALGQKDASPATGLAQRTMIKWVALYAPLKWPPGLQTRPEVDQEDGGTAPGDFAADVAELEALLQRLAAHSAWTTAHPIFGRMSQSAWLRWAYLHTDHHLRQFGR
jgi:hypothetical protein